MKLRKILLATFAAVICLTAIGITNLGGAADLFAVTANAASDGVVQIPADALSSLQDSLIIPNTTAGGVYFYNTQGYTLYFYSYSTGKFKKVYTFGDDYDVGDSYAAGGKLYVLSKSNCRYYDNSYECDVSLCIYDLSANKYLKTLPLYDAKGKRLTVKLWDETAVGVDDSGRIYLSLNDDQIHLFNTSGKYMDKTTALDSVFNFCGFDSSTGDFYYEAYYNWVYWGYDHDMSAVARGNVTKNKFTDEKEYVDIIRQYDYYNRENGAQVLNGKYLCIDSILYSNMTMYSLAIRGEYPPVISTLRNNDDENDKFIDYASLGPRAVISSNGDSAIIVADINDRVEQCLLSDGSVIAHYDTKYPVYFLGNYNNSIVIVEKSNNKFYMETVNWTPAQKIKITAPSSSVTVGGSMLLSVTSDSDISDTVSWSSSDNTVASVTDKGKVVGWKNGKAVITVTSSKGVSNKLTITVTDKLPERKPATSVSASSGTRSDNAHYNDYTVWSSPVTSYMYQNSSNKLVRVENIGDNVVVETYDNNGKLISSKQIKKELGTFGGFYSGKNYNYLVFGQMNKSESDKCEIMRVVKYSKDWKKIKSISVKGANTYIPFEAGSLRMTETGNKLYIHTCHEMYDDTGDGVHHQANMTYVVDETSMTVVDSYYDVMNIAQAGYVSHSFNQFVQTDGKYLFRVDHGDGYPRGITLVKSKIGGDITNVEYTIPVDLSNVTGYNPTGASVGGFELSENNCIIAGNAVDFNVEGADCYGYRNVFVSVTSKDLMQTNVVWLTKYSQKDKITVSTPQLVKLNDLQFLVMWEEQKGSGDPCLKMATIDECGKLTSGIIQSDMVLSDCQPILCSDGMVRWYTTNNSTPKIYGVDPYHLNKIVARPTLKTNYTSTCSEIRINWNKVSGVTGYKIYRYDSAKKKWIAVKAIYDPNATNYKITSLVPNTSYKFIVKAFRKDGSKIYFSDASKTITAKTRSIAKLTGKTNYTCTTNAVRINWNKLSGVTGYKIFRYDDAKKKWVAVKAVYDPNATNYKISGLKAGKVYKFRVKAFVKENGKFYFGESCSTISTATRPNTTTVTKANKTSTAVRLFWKKTTCTGYRILRYDSATKKWVRVTAVGSSSTTQLKISGLKKNTTYKFKVQPYVKVGSKVIDGAASAVFTVKTAK